MQTYQPDNGFNDPSIDCYFESYTQSEHSVTSDKFLQGLYQRLESVSAKDRRAGQQTSTFSSFLSSQNHNQYGQKEKMEEDEQEDDDGPNAYQMDDETATAINNMYAKHCQQEEMNGIGSASTQFSDSQFNSSGNSSQSKQNPKRNIPGLIGGKVRKSAIAFLEGENSEKYQYIAAIFRYYNFSAKVVHEFLHFLNNYSTTKKTWEGVKANFEENSDYGKLFALCVVGFLSNEGEADFYDWLKNGRMKDSSRDILLQDKEEFKQDFITRFGL